MSEQFPSITQANLLRSVLTALENDPALQQPADMVGMQGMTVPEIDGAFQASMLDRVGTGADSVYDNGQRGTVWTRGQLTVTILTSRNDPGVTSSDGGVRRDYDRANAKIQKAMKCLFKLFRPVNSDESGVDGVVDIRYAGSRSAYPYKGSGGWYAVDVFFEIDFILSQDAE